jgi:hypothetical protein
MNMRVIDCIDDMMLSWMWDLPIDLYLGAPPQYRSGVSQLPTNPSTGVYCDSWCQNLKWGRRELWWLDSRQDFEHNESRRVEKDEAGCFHQR